MKLSSFVVILTFGLSACSTASREGGVSGIEDPYLWLEAVESPEALGFARSHAEMSSNHFKTNALYPKIEPEIREIILAKDRIPSASLRGGLIYNFWQDADHVKGIERRTTLAEYKKKAPKWKTLFDLDALSRKEGENWVYKGMNCLGPEYERCLVFLSRGGKDADVIREFSISKRDWVKDGFTIPEAKSRVDWYDRDSLLVATDFGPESLTASGYPRIIKLWKRGSALATAKKVFEIPKEDVSAEAFTTVGVDGKWTLLTDTKTFFESESHLLRSDGTLKKIPLPLDASILGIFQSHLLVQLKSDWKLNARTLPVGALISLPIGKIGSVDFERSLEMVYQPDARSSITGLAIAKDHFYVTTLENVRGRLLEGSRNAQSWKLRKLDLPDHGTVSIRSSDPFDHRLFVSFESFLIPNSVYLFDRKLSVLKRAPDRFQTGEMTVEQSESMSKDGTRIPYFLVHRKDLPLNGETPTLLYGYGGFELSKTPSYLGTFGKVWLERGGAYVLANIRGGGEFGPKWHQATMKEKHQNAFDDFISVAEDLIRRKITSPRRLGIRGGSNGGLLVGAAAMQRPDLFNAVICEVPLLDMMRFHKLLAGNSWIGEYGDPEDPQMREVIRRYSPYQNIRKSGKYPKIFFITNTKDDRVHPGHARKMVARLEEQGHPVWYFEDIEGGHGGGADLEQWIRNTSLQYTYLFEQLMN